MIDRGTKIFLMVFNFALVCIFIIFCYPGCELTLPTGEVNVLDISSDEPLDFDCDIQTDFFKCPVHGKVSGWDCINIPYYGGNKERNYCTKCLIDLLDKNLPRLEPWVEPNE